MTVNFVNRPRNFAALDMRTGDIVRGANHCRCNGLDPVAMNNHQFGLPFLDPIRKTQNCFGQYQIMRIAIRLVDVFIVLGVLKPAHLVDRLAVLTHHVHSGDKEVDAIPCFYCCPCQRLQLAKIRARAGNKGQSLLVSRFIQSRTNSVVCCEANLSVACVLEYCRTHIREFRQIQAAAPKYRNRQ